MCEDLESGHLIEMMSAAHQSCDSWGCTPPNFNSVCSGCFARKKTRAVGRQRAGLTVWGVLMGLGWGGWIDRSSARVDGDC